MGKHSAYKEIETALVNAIWMDNEAPVLSPLNQINEALLINLEVQNQLGYLHRLTRSLETNIRYHQGRAIEIERKNGSVNPAQDLGIPAYEAKVSTKVYKLFKGADCLIGYFFGKVADITNLSDFEIGQLRAYIEDPINDGLDELLDFRFEDESFPVGDLDVSMNPRNP